ncbi:MAG: HD-GYP domain-containing protein [Clostridia bacterium]|nr:HD-GYP domain-containing protein [Clostridia bacterium]
MEEIVLYLKEKQFDIMMMEIGICGLLTGLSFITKSFGRKRKFIFVFISMSSMLLLIFDRYSYMYSGDTSQIGFMMTRMSNFLGYVFILCIILGYNEYLQELLSESSYNSRILKYVRILFVFGIGMAIFSQFTGFYYYFDENNRYVRGEGFFISYIFPLGGLICQLLVIMKNNRLLKNKKIVMLLSFAALPVISSVLQIFTRGISFTNISSVLLVMLLYVFALLDNNKALEDSHNRELEILNREQMKAKLQFEQTMLALVDAFESKDQYLRGHSKRVAEYSVMIAQKMNLSTTETEKLYFSALLHDIGKIAMPSQILSNVDRFNSEEFAIYKTHTSIGGNLLKEIQVFPELSVGALYHHEKYDGSGFPQKLKGEEIPKIARIIAVANVYDNLSSSTYYRQAYTQEQVIMIMKNGKGTEFDPNILDIMFEIINEDKNYALRQK